MDKTLQLIENLRQELTSIRRQIFEHSHDGIGARQINYLDAFGEAPSNSHTEGKTIATTGNTDWYILAPIAGRLIEADFSGTDALAANDTNYITFGIVNLGQDGTGSTNLLSTGNENTTKATGGTALAADTKRALTISATYNNVQKGDRLRIRAAVTMTLANTVTNSVFVLRFR